MTWLAHSNILLTDVNSLYLLKTFTTTILTSFPSSPEIFLLSLLLQYLLSPHAHFHAHFLSLSLFAQNIYSNIIHDPFSLALSPLKTFTTILPPTHSLSLYLSPFILFSSNFPSSPSRMVLTSLLASPFYSLSPLI